MPLNLVRKRKGFSWLSVVAGLIGAVFVHLAYTFSVSGYQTAGVYAQLLTTGKVNQMMVLPSAAGDKTALPYQSPDFRYAVCPFDIASGPLLIDALLLDGEWTLSLHTKLGDTFYSQPGNKERLTKNHLVLLPPGDRVYSASTSERAINLDAARVIAPALEGLAIIHAPVKSGAFTASIERALGDAKCQLAAG